MSLVEVPRPGLEQRLRAAVEAGPPVLLTGPPGAGKTTLLLGLARALEADGWSPVYLDLMGAASLPDRFVLAALDALPAERFGDRLREATELRRLVTSGRPRHAEAVRALLALWATLDRAGGRPVALLLDEVTEIRSLAYFPGLREVEGLLASALAARRQATVLATSFSALARRSFAFEARGVPPLTAAEVDPVLAEGGRPGLAEAVVRASFGWPRYTRVLLERLFAGAPLAQAWAEEMAKGGRLEQLCHHTYEMLLLRSRGYGISKAALEAVAREEGLNLKALVARLGRTPGATRDYLQWLVAVDALRMEGKRYHYVDGLLRLWVRLHTTGTPASPDAMRRAADDLLQASAPATATTPLATDEAEARAPSRRARTEDLMEID